MAQHIISKSNIRDTDWEDQPSELAPNAVRTSIDAFALTANNVTYAVFGGAPMFYWNFFPASEQAFGRVPVWGFGTIVASNTPGIELGRQVYGYFPISDSLDILPKKVSELGFMDGSEHRQALAAIYNMYTFTDQDPSYLADYEAEQMLFRPLYTTGWMICDCLCEGNVSINTAIISSASSKTAMATAHALQARGIEAIGLTSPRNLAFVETSGLYNKAVTYDDLQALKGSSGAAYVDFAGNPDLTVKVHETVGGGLRRSLMIGATDWEADKSPPQNITGPAPEMFFVPSYVEARAKALPKGAFNHMMLKDLTAFYPLSRKFVTPETLIGRDAITQAWVDTVDGRITPDRGLICQLKPG